MTFVEFMRERHGSNWVLAKRVTPRLRAQYDAIIKPHEYQKAQVDYLKAYGPSMTLDQALSEKPVSMSVDDLAVLCGWAKAA